MKNTRKILKVFTCLNFSLIFALTSTISSEAMNQLFKGGGVSGNGNSLFGPKCNKGSERLSKKKMIRQDINDNTTSDGSYANCPSLKYFKAPYTPLSQKDFQDNQSVVLASQFQRNPDQMNSNRSVKAIIPIADFILPNLRFVLPSREELLKYIPNICMKGIMGQLLDQYGGRFPAHEMTLSCLTQANPNNSPIQVLDYNNPTRYVSGLEMKGQYINVQFTRILVKPVAYALRADFTSVHTNHLKTFTLSGKLPNGKWIIIDERMNVYQLARPTSISIFFVNTKHYFSEFRLTQTGPSHANLYQFSLAGFDIHGEVQSSYLSANQEGACSGQ